MTLKDKFQQWFINDEEDEHYEGMVELVSIEHEKIADEFAMSFGRWMASGVEFIDDTEQGRIYDYRHKRYTTEQLLEIFKKENNL